MKLISIKIHTIKLHRKCVNGSHYSYAEVYEPHTKSRGAEINTDTVVYNNVCEYIIYDTHVHISM